MMKSYRESPMGKNGRRRPALKQTLVASTLQLLCGVALAAGYPDRAVTVIVSLPPGSGADTTARLISKHLTEKYSEEGTGFLKGLGGEPFPAGPQEFRNFQVSEIEKAKATARAANIRLE